MDKTIHIYTENDTLIQRIERNSHESGISDANRVKQACLKILVVAIIIVAIFVMVCIIM